MVVLRNNYEVLMLKYIRIFAKGSCKNKPHQIFILDDVKARLSRHKKTFLGACCHIIFYENSYRSLACIIVFESTSGC